MEKGTTWAKVVERTEEVIERKTGKALEETGRLIGEVGMRTMVMIMDAHIWKVMNPGQYGKRLNQMLQMNGVEPLRFPDEVVDSEKLLGMESVSQAVSAAVEMEAREGGES